MLNTILIAIVPVFFVIALGYLAGWMGRIEEKAVAGLNVLVMDFALPAALFVAMAQTPLEILREQRSLMAVLAASMLAVYFLHYFVQTGRLRIDRRAASVEALTTGLPNFASAGLPLVSSVFGPGKASSVGIAIALGSIVMSPLTLVLLESGSTTGPDAPPLLRTLQAIGRSLLKPVVIAPLTGVLVALSGAPLPPLVETSLTLIGVGAGGVALFLTGLILSFQPFELNRNVAAGTVLKNLAHPLLAALLASSLGASPSVEREAILLSAVPSGFFGILFGLRYGVVSGDAGSTLIASTVLSAATLPVVILLTAGMH